jgi:hypothetical protein
MLSTEADSSELRQGDILERNEGLKDAIGQAHQYYSETEGYDYFVVLTPSCDLVLRDGKCQSRYISLAAVRPLSVLVDRELGKYKRSLNVPGLFCNAYRKDRAIQFVERLLHNTEAGYLFLPGEFFSDDIDRCAFLHLSVALRASLHYDACLSAKFKQLETAFSAKVGQLTANLYGQVATPALEEQADIDPKQIKEDYVKRLLEADGRYWLSNEQERALKQQAKEKKEQNGGAISESEVREIFESLSTDQELLANRVVELVAQSGLQDDGIKQVFRNTLVGDPVVGRFLKAR